MLQMQFYASKLTKSQIERMLSNYKIKYTTLKTDLDAKINGMIQIFLQDILAFRKYRTNSIRTRKNTRV